MTLPYRVLQAQLKILTDGGGEPFAELKVRFRPKGSLLCIQSATPTIPRGSRRSIVCRLPSQKAG